jgi:hypothetical protein
MSGSLPLGGPSGAALNPSSAGPQGEPKLIQACSQ